jgi:putative ABC transport system ATP-binding protein/lipoprotein-releasing system ATP-binding protein
MDGEAEVIAVRDISVEISKGEFAMVIGRSGSGKTTLLNLAGGLTRPTSGQVLLDGVDIWRLPDQEQSLLRNRKLGFVFQFASLIPSLTTLENVMLPAIFDPSRKTGATHTRAAELLDTVGLADKLKSYPRQLSAGQQQRVVIARSLINRTEILLADEPTSDLDQQTEMEIMEMFRRIHHDRGITIVMVTHTSELLSYGTRSMEMSAGAIRPESVTTHPA